MSKFYEGERNVQKFVYIHCKFKYPKNKTEVCGRIKNQSNILNNFFGIYF